VRTHLALVKPAMKAVKRRRIVRARPAKSYDLRSTCNPAHLDLAHSGLHESEGCAHQRSSKAASATKSQAILHDQSFAGPALSAS
jgi:hypothetical protein